MPPEEKDVTPVDQQRVPTSLHLTRVTEAVTQGMQS